MGEERLELSFLNLEGIIVKTLFSALFSIVYKLPLLEKLNAILSIIEPPEATLDRFSFTRFYKFDINKLDFSVIKDWSSLEDPYKI